LRRADVVMLGNSRTQRAFSTEATADFFRGIGASFYVAGFGYGENVTFAQALFEKLEPRPRAVIVNADPFFDADVSWPARTLLKTENGEGVYGDKEAWQAVHREVCGGDAGLEWLCGDAPAIFRSVTDGRWHLVDHGAPAAIPISRDPEDPSGVRPAAERERWAERARRFLGVLADSGVPRDCVLFTVVPSDFTTYAAARDLARRFGIEVVTADLAGLATTDGSHLTRPSAERWSAALLERAERRLNDCIAGPGLS
ncbi:MAG TPA: hypothetical protein VK943_20145, partial [Arenibaculum sp.]|nr:hypothetical protein [Arenibaculum sp.]